MRRFAAASILFLVIAAFLGACADDGPMADADGGGGGTNDMAVPEAAERDAVAYDSGSTTSAGGSSIGTLKGGGGDAGVAGSLAGSPDIGPSVIKTASVDLEVGEDGLADATREAIAITGRHGGFVLSTTTRDDRSASSNVVVRVPADSFERALADLEALGEVKGEQITGEDVGQEFVDLAARLRNLEAQEAVLLRLMDRSVSVADAIRVQRELQGVQLEVERLTGRLRYLEDQADMGTISLSLVEAGAPGHKRSSGVLAKAWDRAVDLALRVVGAVIVGTGFLVPMAILAAIAFLAVRALRPRPSS